MKNICAATNRPISELKDIFVTPSQVSELINSDGVSTSAMVIRQDILKNYNLDGLHSSDNVHMPGRIQIADVSSDGFPDIMLTAVNKNGGTFTAILMNSPCI